MVHVKHVKAVSLLVTRCDLHDMVEGGGSGRGMGVAVANDEFGACVDDKLGLEDHL
jgi:hypothetical protein